MSTALPDKYIGTFVSRAICTHPDLSSTEKLVAAEVDGLTTEEGPCRASNAKFSMFCVSEARANAILRELTRKGIIVRLGFHRVYVERVVSPEYSRNPELSRHWIKLRLGENNHPRVSENNHPGQNDETRIGENNGRGWLKTTIEGSRKRLTEISSEVSTEKSNVSRESSTVSEQSSFFAVAGKEDEEEPKQSIAELRKRPPPTEEEKRERLISDLHAKFPQINVRSIADRYIAELDGKPWDDKQFNHRVGEAQHHFWRESRAQ